MYFPNDIWREITSFLFHNIKKHGKHLKNNIYNKNYNNVMLKIPKPTIPLTGPRIVYSSCKKNLRFVRYLYYCKFLDKKFHGTIIETQLLPEDYDYDNNKNDSLLRSEYYTQYFKVSKEVERLIS